MAKKKQSEEISPEFSEEKIIKILEFLGYKKIREGDGYFFLPQRKEIKFMSKLSRDKVLELFKNE